MVTGDGASAVDEGGVRDEGFAQGVKAQRHAILAVDAAKSTDRGFGGDQFPRHAVGAIFGVAGEQAHEEHKDDRLGQQGPGGINETGD